MTKAHPNNDLSQPPPFLSYLSLSLLYLSVYYAFRENGHIQLWIVELPEADAIIDQMSPTPFDETLFSDCETIIFVVDIVDDYIDALTKLCALALRAQMLGYSPPIEVLLHKADGMEEAERQEVLHDVTQKVCEQLEEVGITNPKVSFHLTSIYDHSIFICISRILQKHLAQRSTFEALLDELCSGAKIEKAFLFDIARKLYLAADSSPFDQQSFELSSNVLDLVCDLSSIYCRAKPPNSPRQPVTGSWTHGCVHLSNRTFIAYQRINDYLAIIYLAGDDGKILKPDSAHIVALRDAIGQAPCLEEDILPPIIPNKAV